MDKMSKYSKAISVYVGGLIFYVLFNLGLGKLLGPPKLDYSGCFPFHTYSERFPYLATIYDTAVMFCLFGALASLLIEAWKVKLMWALGQANRGLLNMAVQVCACLTAVVAAGRMYCVFSDSDSLFDNLSYISRESIFELVIVFAIMASYIFCRGLQELTSKRRETSYLLCGTTIVIGLAMALFAFNLYSSFQYLDTHDVLHGEDVESFKPAIAFFGFFFVFVMGYWSLGRAELESYLRALSDKKKYEEFASMDRKKWDGVSVLYSRSSGRYFKSPKEALDCLGDGETIEDLQLVICKPNYVKPLDNENYAGTSEGELSSEVKDAIAMFNSSVLGAILSWSPGNFALDSRRLRLSNTHAGSNLNESV